MRIRRVDEFSSPHQIDIHAALALAILAAEAGSTVTVIDDGGTIGDQV